MTNYGPFLQACRSKMGKDRSEDSVEPGHEIDTIVSKNKEIITGNSKQQDHEDVENKDIIEANFIKKVHDWFDPKPKEIIRILDPPCEDDCLIVYSSSSGKW